MDLGIAGRRAVVTGAGQGIGAAVAELLRAEGAEVVNASRSTGLDVTDPATPARLLDGGQVDILVNNAGTSYLRSLDELSDEDWREQWELHVMGPLRLMRALGPPMRERGWGRIVNVTSSSAKRPSASNAAYSVTKAAQQSLSRVFADEYAGSGVLVNAVAPAATATPLWTGPDGLAEQSGDARAAFERQAAKIPIGRLLEAGEVAAVVAFLCSEAASAVTGAAWSADGGAVPTIV